MKTRVDYTGWMLLVIMGVMALAVTTEISAEEPADGTEVAQVAGELAACKIDLTGFDMESSDQAGEDCQKQQAQDSNLTWGNLSGFYPVF